jgi:integrase
MGEYSLDRMAHSKSIIRAAIERLDTLRGIGESRYDAKRAIREASGERLWTVSTGKIHSHTTRKVYQQHVLAFVNWARETHTIKRLEDMDERADELVTEYLQRRMGEGKSAYTLQAERSALRLFFTDRTLAQRVNFSRRTRTAITRSRGPVNHDRHFQPANWQPLLKFLQATGLRRNEVRNLRVRDIVAHDPDYDNRPTVKVANGKGGKPRTVPVLTGSEQDVLSLKEGRADDEPVFQIIPKHLDVHSYRREYSQALYLTLAPGWSLPPSSGRLKCGDYNAEAVQRVSWALGHNRIDVVLRHYIR